MQLKEILSLITCTRKQLFKEHNLYRISKWDLKPPVLQIVICCFFSMWEWKQACILPYVCKTCRLKTLSLKCTCTALYTRCYCITLLTLLRNNFNKEEFRNIMPWISWSHLQVNVWKLQKLLSWPALPICCYSLTYLVFRKLQILRNLAVLQYCKRKILEVHSWERNETQDGTGAKIQQK